MTVAPPAITRVPPFHNREPGASHPVEIAVPLVGNGVFIVALGVRHGGLDQLSSASGGATAIGQARG